MTSSRPYLVRAFYDWILDNQCTPYIVVDAEQENVVVPLDCVEEGRIVLNVSPMAVKYLQLGNDCVEFEARFSGKVYTIYVPIDAVMAIYARENGRGMVFGEDESGDDTPPPSVDADKTQKDTKAKGKRSHLKVVK